MKKLLSRLSLLTIGCQLLAISSLNAQTGTWTKVTTSAPHNNQGCMLLLTDGTVICHNSNGGTYGTGWDKLTPDATGSYVNGTWTSIASMHNDRLFFPTQVMPNGEVFAAGGEYGPGGTAGEYYNPVANTWTLTGAVVSTQNIYDGNSQILPDGRILVGVQDGLHPSFDNLYYSNVTNAWTTAPISVTPYNHDEAEWLKLPDSSILFVGIASTASCRYRPQTSTWITDGTVPTNLYDVYGEEAGAAFMLPNGKAVFFGARGTNATYTPTGNTTNGAWATTGSFPTVRGTQVGQPDAAGAMMVNGHILLSCSPIGTSANNEFNAPIYFAEYDYTTGVCTQVKSAIPGTGVGGDSIPGESCYQCSMLDLPNGTVMMAVNQAGNTLSKYYWIYTPGSAAIAAGKPTINSILADGCPNYKITGKLFNGISEGAAYGDDWQESTNYPLVRLSNGTDVYYAKTTNWNRIGAVQTDSLEDTAVFTTPAALPSGTYSLVVVVNGFASNPVLFTVLGISTVNSTNISCSTPVGTASVTASGGLTPLTYTWTPGGQTGANVSNLSAGTYTITVSDHNDCTATSTVVIMGGGTITVSANVSANITCNGGNNGSASSAASGGSGAYTFSWSGGIGTTAAVSGLSAGTYTVTAHDSCGSSGTASAIITQPAAMGVLISAQTNVSCAGNGSATASAATGGTSPYTYSWTSGEGTNLSATNLSAGTYTITATDNHGCTATTAVTITQAASSVGITLSTLTNPLCSGGTGSATVNAATGGTSPYTYLWTGGGGSGLTATNLIAGSYTITATDNNGCTATALAIITQPTSIGISLLTVLNVTCNGGAGSAYAGAATGGTSPYTYLWTGGGGSGLTATNLTAGSYTITATDNNGCTATASAIITQPAPIGISIATQTNVSCNGGTGTATANAATGGTSPYTYLWSGAGGANLTANLNAGSYTITATDNNGCTVTAAVVITQPAALSILADSTKDNGTCNGSAWAVVTGGTAAYSYLWTGGLTSDTITNQCTGDYCCTVTDANGCMDSVCVEIPITTGIKNVAADKGGITIYPNPNNGTFTIESSAANSQLSVEIYNVLGEKIFSSLNTTNQTFKVDLSSQPSGLYFYRVLKQNGNMLGEGKIVVEK